MLVGLGVDEFSVAPSHVRDLAARIHSLDERRAHALAHTILEEATSTNEVKQDILAFLAENNLMTLYSESIVGPMTRRR